MAAKLDTTNTPEQKSSELSSPSIPTEPNARDASPLPVNGPAALYALASPDDAFTHGTGSRAFLKYAIVQLPFDPYECRRLIDNLVPLGGLPPREDVEKNLRDLANNHGRLMARCRYITAKREAAQKAEQKAGVKRQSSRRAPGSRKGKAKAELSEDESEEDGMDVTDGETVDGSESAFSIADADDKKPGIDDIRSSVDGNKLNTKAKDTLGWVWDGPPLPEFYQYPAPVVTEAPVPIVRRMKDMNTRAAQCWAEYRKANPDASNDDVVLLPGVPPPIVVKRAGKQTTIRRGVPPEHLPPWMVDQLGRDLQVISDLARIKTVEVAGRRMRLATSIPWEARRKYKIQWTQNSMLEEIAWEMFGGHAVERDRRGYLSWATHEPAAKGVAMKWGGHATGDPAYRDHYFKMIERAMRNFVEVFERDERQKLKTLNAFDDKLEHKWSPTYQRLYRKYQRMAECPTGLEDLFSNDSQRDGDRVMADPSDAQDTAPMVLPRLKDLMAARDKYGDAPVPDWFSNLIRLVNVEESAIDRQLA